MCLLGEFFKQLNMTVFFFLFMVLKILKLIQGLLSGYPSMGATDLVQPAMKAASVAAGAVGNGVGLASVGMNAGAGRMSAISNIAGGVKDMMTGGFKNMVSSGSGASDIQSGMSKMGIGISEAGKGITAMGSSVHGMAKNAIATSAALRPFQSGVNSAHNPYGFSTAEKNQGAETRSLFTGHAVDAKGNDLDSGGSSGVSGSGNGGHGRASNPNEDGTESAEHNKKVNDQVHVQHVTNLDDQGVNIDYSVGGQNYSVTVKHNPPPQGPVNIEPINPNKD